MHTDGAAFAASHFYLLWAASSNKSDACWQYWQGSAFARVLQAYLAGMLSAPYQAYRLADVHEMGGFDLFKAI